jgi:hypothetical protein
VGYSYHRAASTCPDAIGKRARSTTFYLFRPTTVTSAGVQVRDTRPRPLRIRITFRFAGLRGIFHDRSQRHAMLPLSPHIHPSRGLGARGMQPGRRTRRTSSPCGRQVTISRNHSYDDGLWFSHYTLFVAGNDTATGFIMILTYSFSLVQDSSDRRQQCWSGATHIT